MDINNARSAALSTPEILELILLQLDLQTLLTAAQQTCQTWFKIIRDSPAIQKFLFFVPVKPSPTSKKTQNPLLAKKFPDFFQHTDHDYSPTLLPSADMLQHPDALKVYLRPEASWRRMLVQQPPIFLTGHFSTGCNMFSSYFSYYEIQRGGNGLRMGEYFELLIFDSDWPLEWGTPDIIWRGNTTTYFALERMKELKKTPVNSDLVFYWAGPTSCMDEEESTEDTVSRDRILAVYKEFGLQPNSSANQSRIKLNAWNYSRSHD